jgi:hypothetical protein
VLRSSPIPKLVFRLKEKVEEAPPAGRFDRFRKTVICRFCFDPVGFVKVLGIKTKMIRQLMEKDEREDAAKVCRVTPSPSNTAQFLDSGVDSGWLPCDLMHLFFFFFFFFFFFSLSLSLSLAVSHFCRCFFVSFSLTLSSFVGPSAAYERLSPVGERSLPLSRVRS